ncbi:unnamed protein product [Adineta steineri]|uniref:Uncharacterized protein n=1 Tax=Adineta steineri TaxID=433720 RepID=A0A815NUW9_9BILA|nr:unnamed protein product [Adineta steineri]CAF4215861.1 unnamed protein product [Adineta steineri]
MVVYGRNYAVSDGLNDRPWYIAIGWGKCRNLMHIGYMIFDPHGTQKSKLVWILNPKEIQELKEAVVDKPLLEKLLDKALSFLIGDSESDVDPALTMIT